MELEILNKSKRPTGLNARALDGMVRSKARQKGGKWLEKGDSGVKFFNFFRLKVNKFGF